MRIINCEQRTEEWYQARLGKPTASEFDKIITTEGKPSKQRQKYMFSLAAQRLSGQIDPLFVSHAMQKGIDNEGGAKRFYELIKGKEVKDIGFCLHDNEKYGCSPDGLVGEDGLVEVKCPQGVAQIEYLLDGEVPNEYFIQVQGQLLVTGKKWCDFISYYPGIKPLIVREEPETVFQKVLIKELDIFINELNDLVRKLS